MIIELASERRIGTPLKVRNKVVYLYSSTFGFTLGPKDMRIGISGRGAIGILQRNKLTKQSVQVW